MEITNLLKVKATKSVLDSIDSLKLVDVIVTFSEKQFGAYKNDFLYDLQGLLVRIIQDISKRRT